MSRSRNRNNRYGGRHYNKNRKQGRKNKQGLGIFVNRRNPGFWWVSFGDVWYNIKERLYCWWQRVPEGSYIAWDKNGNIKGHSTRAKRPYFKKKTR